MRIGYMTPRLNGVGVVPVADLVSQDLLSWTNYPGGGGTPAQFAAAVGGDVAGYCRNWDCSGVDVNGLVAAAAGQYASWYGGQQIQSPYPQYQVAPPPGYTIDPYSGAYVQIPAPLPPYVPPPNTNPNALNTVAPQPVSVNPVQARNVLNPPQPMPPVQGTNSGSYTGGDAGNSTPAPVDGSANWFSGSTSIAGMDVPNMALLAGAGIGLLLLMRR